MRMLTDLTSDSAMPPAADAVFDPIHPQLRRRRRYRRITYAGLILLALSAVLDRAGVFRYSGNDWRALRPQVVRRHPRRRRRHDRRPPAGRRRRDPRPPDRRRRPGAASRDDGRRATGPPKPRLPAQRADGKTRHPPPRADRNPRPLQRLLAYVYVGDTDNLNLDLVRDGHAYADRRFPHSMRPQFERARERSPTGRPRDCGRTCEESQMPAWRRDVAGRSGDGGRD